MKELFLRDIRVAFSSGNNLVTNLMFFLAVIITTPLGIGPMSDVLSHISAGIVWIAALLTVLLGLDQLFQTDREEGSLDVMVMGTDLLALALIVFVKCLAHWAGTILPLIIASPFFALLLNMEWAAVGATVISLLLGTPAITFIGAVGAALTITLPRVGVMLSVIVLPLVIPVLIFGVSAVYTLTTGTLTPITPLLFLLALTLFFSVLGPTAAATTFKYMSE
ncbi:MAG: heme exporter protein B [Candidatus Tokpelaia sp. JSC189]|nr:MAG: heme exporter protein B [Candidatus Tokpelaia sp. JSC189]